MTGYPTEIIITLAYWLLNAVVAYLLFRGIRRVIRLLRRHRKSAHLLLWPALGAVVLALSVSTGYAAGFTAALAIAIFSPLMLLALVQIAFWLYHAFKHGDPFYEPDDARNVRVIYRGDEAKKRQKKMCPICKRPTRCKVSPRGAPIPFHVIRD